jgi:acyl carrier protein
MRTNVDRVKRLIEAFLRHGSTAVMVPATIPEECDLRAEGLIDSLGFVQLVAHLEQALGYELDLSDLAPEDLTVFGPLAVYIASREAQGRTVTRKQMDSEALTRATR